MPDVVKTLIDIDPELLRQAMEYSGLRTKKAVVTMLLQEYVRKRALDEYVEFVKSGALDDLGDPEIMAGAHRR